MFIKKLSNGTYYGQGHRRLLKAKEVYFQVDHLGVKLISKLLLRPRGNYVFSVNSDGRLRERGKGYVTRKRIFNLIHKNLRVVIYESSTRKDITEEFLKTFRY